MSSNASEKGGEEMYLKIYRQDREVLIAVCDCEIMGQKFKDGPLQIEISTDFFGDVKATTAEVQQALEGATMANFAGCRCVEHAISLGLIDRDCVLSIDGVPTAQMVRM